MNAVQKFEAALSHTPLVGILRGLQPREARDVGVALTSAGMRLIEVPLNSPEPLKSVAILAQEFPQALVGAGTVLTVDDVRQVQAAGGQLVVSPNFNAAVVREAVRLGMVCLPGVMTPTEIFAALEAGAHGLKLFPAELIDPAVIKALRAVVPAAVPLLPVGGISTANMRAYREAGATGFGIGSALYKPGMPASQVLANATRFVAAVTGLG